MKYIVVNKHRVAANRRTGNSDPVFRISHSRYGRPWYAKKVEFEGPCIFVYDPEHPLPCGASVWIEGEDIRLTEVSFPKMEAADL